MGRDKLIYRSDGNSKSGIIPDRMEVGVTITSYGVSYAEFLKLGGHDLYSRSGKGFKRNLNYKGIDYKLFHSFSKGSKKEQSCLRTTIYRQLNGNTAYRRYYDLPEPEHKSCDGRPDASREANFITHEEVTEVLKRPSGLTRHQFTLQVLPDIIMEEVEGIFRDLCQLAIQDIRLVAPSADIKTSPSGPNTFSFQLIELANDIKIPKRIVVSGTDKVKEFDPTTSRNFLENLAILSKEVVEKDAVDKDKYVAASSVTYKRGRRILNFKFYEKGISGRAYIKYAKGIEYDVFRIEFIFSKQIKGGVDTIYYLGAGARRFQSANDIKRIFQKLADKVHEMTAALFAVPDDALSPLEREARLRKLLTPHFGYPRTDEVIEHLIAYRFKVCLKHLPYAVQNKIKELASKGYLFKPCTYGKQTKGRTGEYYFDRAEFQFKEELLGNRKST